MSHTPTPWKISIGDSFTEVHGPSRTPIVSWMGFDDSNRDKEEHEANAEHIVRCVNSHDALLGALKKARSALGAHGPCTNNSCRECGRAWDAIRAAIALAEGETP